MDAPSAAPDGDRSDDIALRAVSEADVAVVTELIAAQDVAWWGEPDGGEDDTRQEFDRVRLAVGSVEAGARLAVRGDVPVGVALAFDHGQTTVAVDPTRCDAAAVFGVLVEWLLARRSVDDPVGVDAPVGDIDRIGVLAELGFERERSSFELERSADVGDLGPVVWPEGYGLTGYRPGVDEQELHDMIYSVWTDVPGHTHRPFEEWRKLFVSGPTFDPALAVLVRRTDGSGRAGRGDGADGAAADALGPIAGVAIGRRFPGGVGWVAQLAVGRPDRGVGLGRSILVETFHRLAAHDDARILALGVEAENEAALGLYRSVGLAVAREYVHFTHPRTPPSPRTPARCEQ